MVFNSFINLQYINDLFFFKNTTLIFPPSTHPIAIDEKGTECHQ